MNWDQVKGNWRQMKGQVKMHWGRITCDDIEVIEGKYDQLVGKLQERYGIAKEEAEGQVAHFLRTTQDQLKTRYPEMVRKSRLAGICAGLLLLGATAAVAGDNTAANRVTRANTVFTEIMASDDKSIPQDLLSAAHCVVIVPSLKKGGFVVGAQYGVGVATCRAPGNKGWTAPSTVKMEGGSFGLQIGGGEVDMVLMVMNASGAQKLMSSQFTLGGEAGAMAGPVGRNTTAETDAAFKAEILSYSRSNGIFAGVAVKGSTLRPDDEQNRELYGRDVTHNALLTGKISPPAVAQPLLTHLSKYSPREMKSNNSN